MNRTKKTIATLALTAALTGCATTGPKPYEGKPDQVPKVPGVKNAKVKTLWIPDRVESNRWEAGHFLYVIDEQSTWKVE